jgi:hypothetical protein
LDFQRKFLLRATKNRLAAPSEICALEFKRRSWRFGTCVVSRTIAEAFDELVEFIEGFWGSRLRRLKQAAEGAERIKAKK